MTQDATVAPRVVGKSHAAAAGATTTSATTMPVSVCICTRNRPDALCSAIRSVLESQEAVQQIVISDDSTDTRTRRMIAENFADEVARGRLVLVDGPRRGLGANRNMALRHASGERILFIDDDVLLAPTFLGEVAAVVAADAGDKAGLIVSGTEINHGERVFPHKLTYLGYQAIDYRPGDRYETVVINSAVFPRALFDRVKFDENLIYGCDEMDLTTRAVHLHGFRILLAAGSANLHFPSTVNRDFYEPFAEASRIYVTFKRYVWVERRWLKGSLYLVAAYAHILMHHLRGRGFSGFAAFGTTFGKSIKYIRLCSKEPARFV